MIVSQVTGLETFCGRLHEVFHESTILILTAGLVNLFSADVRTSAEKLD